MNLHKTQKFFPYIIYSAVLLLVIIIIGLAVVFYQLHQQNLRMHPDQNKAYLQSFKKIAEKEKDSTAQNQKIAELTMKLPYQGTLIKLEYNINQNSYTATLDGTKKDEALKELNQYLQNNGIPDSKLLSHFQIIYK